MCKSPIVIKNPNYGLGHIGYNYLKDTESAYLNIPCGVCDECIANKQMQLVQRIQMEAEHNHLFFSTLTYNNAMIPVYECSNGVKIRYADMADFVHMVKRLRKKNLFPRPFRYFVVSERGTERGRPHIHVLWLLPKNDDDTLADCLSLQESLWRIVLDNWTRNVGSRKYPKYLPLCTFRSKYIYGKLNTNYDLHYVNPNVSENGVADVAFYILKYMTKPSTKDRRLQQALKLNLDAEEYDKCWSVVRSRYSASLDFGLSKHPLVQKYLRTCIAKTPKESGYPFYYNPISGQSFPLSRFYRSKSDIYTMMDAHDFYFNYKERFSDVNRSQQLKKWKEFEKRTDISLDRGASLNFDDFEN